MKKFRKGLSAVGTVTGIILVILFIVFGIVIYIQLNPSEIVDESSCENSIILRDAVNFKLTDSLVDSVPLKCETEYVCYSKEGVSDKVWEKIKSLFVGKEEKIECPDNYEKVVVSSKEEIIADLATREAKWWKLTGKGEKDYYPSSWFSNYDKYCAVAVKIKFDGSIQEDEKLNKINYKEFFEYMENNDVSGTTTSFLKYLYDIDDAQDFIDSINAGYENKIDIADEGINTAYDQIVILGFYKQGQLVPVVTAGTAVAVSIGLAVATGGASIPASLAVLSSSSVILGVAGVGAATYTTGIIVQRQGKTYYVTLPTIIPADSLAQQECDDFSTIS